MNKLIWKPNQGQFSSGKSALLGKVWVFTYHWDACQNKDSLGKKPWRISTMLPGLKDDLGHFENEKEVELFAEKALEHWLKITGLTTNQTK